MGGGGGAVGGGGVGGGGGGGDGSGGGGGVRGVPAGGVGGGGAKGERTIVTWTPAFEWCRLLLPESVPLLPEAHVPVIVSVLEARSISIARK